MSERNSSAAPGITDRWVSWAPELKAVLRIVAGLLFVQYGTMKLLAFPVGMPPNGGTAPLMSLIGVAGILELVGGVLIAIGLFTRPVAFILSGEMAAAYFMGHFPKGFWPVVNQGSPAILFCFIFLYLSAAGAGPWSVDASRGKA